MSKRTKVVKKGPPPLIPDIPDDVLDSYYETKTEQVAEVVEKPIVTAESIAQVLDDDGGDSAEVLASAKLLEKTPKKVVQALPATPMPEKKLSVSTNHLKIYLRDKNKDMVEAWNVVFHDPRVKILAEAYGVELEFDIAEGTAFDITTPCDVLVSQANGTGTMTNIMDMQYVQKFGARIESELINQIAKKHHGLLPVGRSVIISLAKYTEQFRFLIAAPVLATSASGVEPLGLFLAFKGILELIETYNSSKSKDCKKQKITSVACSGFGTGLVGVPVFRSALQMRAAIDSFFGMGFVGKNLQAQREFYVFLTTIKKPFNIQTLYNP